MASSNKDLCSECGRPSIGGYSDVKNRLCAGCDPQKKKKKAPSQSDEVEFICGIPQENLQPWEIKYLEDEKGKYKQNLVSDKAIALVEEVVICSLQLRRNMIEQEQCGIGSRDLKTRKLLAEERDTIFNRQAKALDAMGALPKQDKGESVAEQALTVILNKYRKEKRIRERATDGVLGGFSAEAKQLAEQMGRDIKDFDVPIERITDPSETDELLEQLGEEEDDGD